MSERRPPGAAVHARARHAKDWAGNWRTLAAFWGVPAAAMLASMLLGTVPRAVVWSAALIWMGGACLANARRCSRTHCRFTGPFFLVMVVPVITHASGVLPLGNHGWALLAAATIVGNAAIWWASEHIWGTFSPTRWTGGQDGR